MATIFWTGGKGDGLIASAGNWSGGAAPGAGDTVVFRDNANNVAPGQTSAAATYTRLIIDASYTGTIGLPASPWIVAATTVEIGSYAGIGTASHSGSINLNTTTVASTVHVYDSATLSSLDADRPPIYLLANEATTTINIWGGYVGLSDIPGDTTTIATLNIGYRSSTSSSPIVSVGQGCTMTTLNIRAGTNMFRGIVTNISQYGGTTTVDTTDALGTVSVYGGTMYIDQCGTITTLAITATQSAGAIVDMLRTSTARTITNTSIGRGVTLRIDTNNVTQTNKIDFLYPVSCTVTGV